MSSHFESKRFLLKPLSELDISTRYIGWMNDPEINRYMETRFERHDFVKILNFVDAQNNNPNVGLWGIFTKETELHIGNIKLGPVNKHHKNADISLLIGEKNYWGIGAASEVIRAVTQFGFSSMMLDKIEAGCYEENQRSLHAFLKVGYKNEGFLRKHVLIDGKRMGVIKVGILPDELI